MTIEAPKPLDTLNTLTVALMQFRQLAALPDADPFYARSAEQIAAIVTELQSHATPAASPPPDSPQENSGIPRPPSPGVIPEPRQQDSGFPDPPSPGVIPEPRQQDSGFPDPPSPG
jgi:hypothetical protein